MICSVLHGSPSFIIYGLQFFIYNIGGNTALYITFATYNFYVLTVCFVPNFFMYGW